MYDSDNEEYGLLSTNCPKDKVEELWKKYYDQNFSEDDKLPKTENWEEDISVDGFATYLKEIGFKAERVFVEEIKLY